MVKKCFQCGKKGSDMYGYVICDKCKLRLGLLTDKTIEKYNSKDFPIEIKHRLAILENDYKKKKIKLLYIQDRLKKLK